MTMPRYDIPLQATESNWRLFMVRKADPAFLAFSQKILQRDNYTCQFCGYRAEKFQEIVNLDGNFRHNKSSNLATACSFCAQCFFLEGIGKGDFGGGSLIFLPEMSQGELNALCHILFAHMILNTSDANQAKNIYRSLKLRSQQVEQQFGEGMSNPSLYGQLLIDVPLENKQDINQGLMQQLRVLPNLGKYAGQVAEHMMSGISQLMF